MLHSAFDGLHRIKLLQTADCIMLTLLTQISLFKRLDDGRVLGSCWLRHETCSGLEGDHGVE